MVLSIGCTLGASKKHLYLGHIPEILMHFKNSPGDSHVQPTLKIIVLRALFGSCMFHLNIRCSQKKVFLFSHIQRELGEGVTWGLPIFFLEIIGDRVKRAEGGMVLLKHVRSCHFQPQNPSMSLHLTQ